MRIHIDEDPNVNFKGAGLLCDEFLPLVVLNKQKFEELNNGIDALTTTQGLEVAKGIDIADDEDNYTYTIESNEDEITIPLLVKQGSEDTILDDDGIISITFSEKMPEINLTKNQFTTKYGEEVEFKIKRDDPTFEKEFEIKIVAEDNVDDDYFDGELKDVLCGGIKIKFKKKEVKFETLRIKVLDCRSNEPVANVRVNKISLKGAYEVTTDFNSQEFNKKIEYANSENKIKQSQQALDGLGFDTKNPGNKYGDSGRNSYNAYWKSRFPELIEKGVIQKITEGNPSEEMLNHIILEHNNNCSTDENGILSLKIPCDLLKSETTLDISFYSAYIFSGEEIYSRTKEYSIKTGEDKFSQFNGSDINQDILEIKVYKLKEIFRCTKMGNSNVYGPYFYGDIALDKFSKWNEMIANKEVTESEKNILVAVSKNEGRLNSMQSYDSEVLSIGAIQKTIKTLVGGELTKQIREFKEENLDKYNELFENNGWSVDNNKVFFKSILDLQNNKLTGQELKTFIRYGFNSLTYGRKLGCEPLENILKATKDVIFQTKQIKDFIDRLRTVQKIKPNGYSYNLSDFLKSELGIATALDQHVNRPAFVKSDFAKSLNHFFKNKDEEVANFNKKKKLEEHIQKVSRNPNDWGDDHKDYEKSILEHYGVKRRGMHMELRYNKLKQSL